MQNDPYYVSLGFTSTSPAETVSQYSIAWGDGQTTTAGTNPNYGGQFQHVYYTYGTVTLRAEVDTNVTQYVSTQTLAISPNFGFIVSNPATAESGAPFRVNVSYAGVDPMPNYTLDWGDGMTYSGNSHSLSHAYTFDPYWPPGTDGTWTYNVREYTLTEIEAGQTATVTGGITIHPSGGAGSVQAGSNTTVVEGQTVTLNAGFTDSDFGSYNDNGTWSIDWGDVGGRGGSFTGDLYSRTAEHVYTKPGNYTVQWDVVYEDEASTFDKGNWVPDTDAFQTVNVLSYAPTVTASGPPSVTAGVGYRASGTFTTLAGLQEAPQQWTVDWGDGRSSIFYDADKTVAFNHTYDSPGGYTIQMMVMTDQGTYAATTGVSVAPPIVSISHLYWASVGVAYEQSQSPDWLLASRSTPGEQPLTVNFSTGGTANSSEYELTDANTGQILTGSVTIPADTQFATIAVTALEDFTPAWTDTVDLTLGTSTQYTLSPTATTAVTDIVNDDLGITLGFGSGNNVLVGSDEGKGDLVPLFLNYPAKMENGAALTLSVSQPNEVALWTTSTPSGEDVPVLGNGTASVVYVYGSDELPPATLWVGGLSHSTAMNDISFTFSDSDAGTTPTPAVPTTNTVRSKAATCVTVQLKELDANSQYTGADVSDLTQNWMVGQFVDLQADVGAPPGVKARRFHWSVPGNVLANYNDTDAQAVETTLAGSVTTSNGMLYREITGTQRSEVKFFWVANTEGEAAETDQVSVVVGPVLGATVAESTTYNVEEPTSSFGVAPQGQGDTKLHQPPITAASWLELGDRTVRPNPKDGIDVASDVGMPANLAGLGAGQWKIVQLITVDRTAQTTFNGVAYNNLSLPTNNQSVLDWSDPYDEFVIGGVSVPLPNPAKPAPAPVFSTGDPETMGDIPAVGLDPTDVVFPGAIGLQHNVTLQEAKVSDVFGDYQMFKPPGDSVWVPLNYQSWSWNAQVSLAGGQYGYVGLPSGPSPDDPNVALSEPLWTTFIREPGFVFHA
jgi:hypothetical protein